MATPNPQPYFIFVLGPPGAGKGTLCSRLAKENGFYHLSVGDSLREVCSKGSALSEKILPYMSNEKLIPDDVLKKMFDDDILPMVRAEKYPCIIVDGFPRSASQIPNWGEEVPQLVLFFDCPREIAAKRVIERARGGASPESLAAIFEQRYAQFEAEHDKIVGHYAMKEGGLPISLENPFHLIIHEDGMNQSMIATVDTSKTIEESWDALKSRLEICIPWKKMIEKIASAPETSENASPESAVSPDSPVSAGEYDGDDEDEGDDENENGDEAEDDRKSDASSMS
jgi:UMP-CMP kinase